MWLKRHRIEQLVTRWALLLSCGNEEETDVKALMMLVAVLASIQNIELLLMVTCCFNIARKRSAPVRHYRTLMT